MISIERLAEFLRITNSTEDDYSFLSTCLTSAQSDLEQNLGRPLSTTSFSDVLDYWGEKFLIFPISGVDTSTVKLYTRANKDDSFTEVTDGWYWQKSGQIIIIDKPQNFYAGRRLFQVAYSAGWQEDNLPGDLEKVLIQMVRALYRGRDLSMRAETFPDVTISYADDPIPQKLWLSILLRHGRKKEKAWFADVI